MALVRLLERSSKARNHIHEEVDCSYTDFIDPKSNERFLQLDTFGRAGREIPGKLSQTFQLGREGAMQLKQIIEQVFGL